MEPIRRFLGIRALWPLWAGLAAALVILPNLGGFGFWEPQEIAVADAAKKRLERYSLAEITGAVAGSYKVRGPDLPSTTAPPSPSLARARAMGVYLARERTREPDFEIAQAFAMPDEAALEAAEAEIRAGLDGDPALIAEHEALIAKLEGVRDRRLSTERQTRPDFTERAVALGISWRQDEWGARLPLALLGLLALIATYYLGFRLGGARAGLLSSLVLLSFPLFLFQSRQLTSDIGAVTGSTLLMAGLAGLAWPADGRAGHRLWFYAVDAVLVAVGSLLAFEATGALLGLVPAVAATALACGIALLADGGATAFPPPLAPGSGPPRADRTWRLIHLLAGVCVAALATAGLLAWVLAATFDLTDAKGATDLFGLSYAPSTEYVAALGGVWKVQGDLNQTFDSLFDQIAFGGFPWVALAPVAIAHLAIGGRRGRRAWAGYLMFGWAAIAWAIAAVMQRKVGAVHYPALAALAIGIALWLDDLIEARRWAEAEEGDRDTLIDRCRARFGLSPALPLAALFVAAAALVIGKDLKSFAEELSSVHVLGAAVAYPKGLDLKQALPALAFAFAVPLGLALWLWLPRRPRIGNVWREFPVLPGLLLIAYAALVGAIRWEARPLIGLGLLALVAALISLLFIRRSRRPDLLAALAYRLGRVGLPWATLVALLCAGWLAHCWTPELATKLSSRKLFAAYHRHREPGDRLGVMGASGSGPKYYAGGTFDRIDNRNELLAFLSDQARGFALMPASELCPVHRAAKGKFEYTVLDDSNAQFLLVVNDQLDGADDRNPLARTIRREPPEGMAKQAIANYDGKIELIGVDMPRSVKRGSTFEMTLYYRVLASIGGDWKVFVHFDGGGMKFQGDHSLVDTVRCGTNHWQAGDYIVDRFTAEAGDISYARTTYTAHVGFFQGSHGSWKNMKVVSGPKDKDDRVRVGTITVQ